MFLSILFNAVLFYPSFAVALEMGPGAHYQGTFRAKASSNRGESFSKNFRVTVDYRLDYPVRGQASSAAATLCDVKGVAGAGECNDYCVTKVSFELGRATISILNLENGATYSISKPVKANVSRPTLMGARRDCTVPASLEGEKVVSGEVGALFMTGGKSALYFVVDPMTPESRDQDHVYISKLRFLGGTSYEVLPVWPNPATIAYWQYSETASWGTSGHVPLK
jgi:hypothetical protein